MKHQLGFVRTTLMVSLTFGVPSWVDADILPPELPHSFQTGNGYRAEWGLTGDGQLAMRLSAETTGWVGIGFSQNRLMPSSDIVLGAATADGSIAFIEDRFAFARAEPRVDIQQDIEMLSATHDSGLTTIEFLRPLSTGDVRDDFDLAAGEYFLLYAWGGTVSDTGRLGQHARATRVVSTTRFDLSASGVIPNFPPLATPLQAGDSDQDFDFDQLDLVQVQIAAKYLTGQTATWGEGDWNGAPGGSAGAPPTGDGQFNQFDVIAAQQAGVYLTGPYAAIQPAGQRGDDQTSIIYDPNTGELAVDAPAGAELTSINIDSAAAVLTGQPAQNLGGSFDNDADDNIFKATFGSSFGSLSFGNVAQTGLAESFVLDDFTVVGSLAGGGDLGDVDLIYVPEPASFRLIVLGLIGLLGRRRPRCNPG